MTPNLPAHALSGADQKATMSSRVPAAPDVLDQGTIANLPSTRISELQSDDLVRVIQAADLPFLSAETGAHLAFLDHQTLERLANLARRCCLNRTTRPGTPVGNCH